MSCGVRCGEIGVHLICKRMHWIPWLGCASLLLAASGRDHQHLGCLAALSLEGSSETGPTPVTVS